MDDNLTDQQRADQVRDWFKDSGWSLVAGLVLGLGALFGWRQWSGNNAAEAEQASALYEELVTAVRIERTVRAEEIAADLARDYKGTPYLDHARLLMARTKIDSAQPDEAVRYLEMVIKETSSEEIGHVARLRLGRVLLHQEKYDEALKVLVVPKDSAFGPRYHEVRGDAYFAMGSIEEARKEYEAALAGVSDGSVDPGYLGAKLDDARARTTAGIAAEPPAPAAK